MKIYDIDTLIPDRNQDVLFNLFVRTYQFQFDFPVQSYVVPFENAMRIDLVCQDIYSNSTDEIDILLNINNIDNPLNIMEGDVLVYPPLTAVTEYRVTDKQREENRNLLVNPNKSTRKDDARQKYVENNYTLPPNLAIEPKPQVKVENDRLIIG